jgi:hypothetical protein
MSFKNRMSAIVGDENTVARYLFEKISHVAFIAWVGVFFFHVPSTASALWALAVYTLAGKVLWLVGARERAKETERVYGQPLPGRFPIVNDAWQVITWKAVWVDTAFDLGVASLPAIVSLPLREFTYLLALWLIFIPVGSNNQWGSPS